MLQKYSKIVHVRAHGTFAGKTGFRRGDNASMGLLLLAPVNVIKATTINRLNSIPHNVMK